MTQFTLKSFQTNFKKVFNLNIWICTFFYSFNYFLDKTSAACGDAFDADEDSGFGKMNIQLFFLLFTDIFSLQNHRCKLHSLPKMALLKMWIARMRISRSSTARIDHKQVSKFFILIYVTNSILIADVKPAQSQQPKSKKRTYPSVATSDEWFRIYQEEEAEKLAVEEAKKLRIQQRAANKMQKEKEKQQRADERLKKKLDKEKCKKR